ncbi:pentapeptide repeat-containing protein [Microcoleus sp. herbarium2]|uniref:pentapeptide repeat-containing protein n=1 Tax=Microcoleus sp. herbarium2 TaxID=3055433 RepID=UPI002FD6325A
MDKIYYDKNLQGKNFKGKNLTGFSFMGCDIRGADFTDAILREADFHGAISGLQRYSAIGLVVISCIVASILAIILEFAGQRAGDRLVYKLNLGTSPDNSGINIWITIIILTIFVTFICTIHKGIEPAFKMTLGVGTVFVSLSLIYALAQAVARVGVGYSGETIAGYAIRFLGAVATGSITAFGMGFVAVGMAIAITVAEIANGNKARYVVMFVTVVTGISIGAVARTSETEFISIFWGVVIVIASVLLGYYIASKVWDAPEKYALVSNIAVVFANVGGTSFRDADLTDATFKDAILKSTDFRKATVTRTCWSNTKYLEQARFGGTILVDPNVRNLLVTLQGINGNYVGCNLKGSHLVDAILSNANFTEADISDANLEGTCLKDSNLTKAQALGTKFNQAILTGACLEAWNTDSNTQLQDAICDYIYLLSNQRERRPSSGNFAPGEFGKLYQQFLDTVVLIFRNGVDWKAFVTAFKKVQVENEGTELAIQSIENKGDGVVLVRVSVPPDTNKGKIHSEFIQNYDLALKAIEEKYQSQIESKDEQITLYRQQLEDSRQREIRQNSNMEKIIDILANTAANVPVNESEVKAIAQRQTAVNLVILTLGTGDFEKGFASVTAQIWTEGERLPIQHPGKLLSAPDIVEVYHNWQSQYNRFIGSIKSSRMEGKQGNITNFSKIDIYKLAEQLEEKLNKWLNAEQFLSIDRILRERFKRSDEIQVIIQSQNIEVRRLPWHLWDFIRSYRKAEIALSSPLYDRILKTAVARKRIRILSILGDDQKINLDKDRQLLAQFDAETSFLVKPNRQELDAQLWDEKGWDILCFSGHSSSEIDGSTGYISINDTDKLTITDLKNGLKTALARGLQIAIFNSCDGLGLANQLAQLHIPQVIIFREPVPDIVAQEFLKNFLTAFASGKSFYLAVREAREKLQSLETHFPCASWLPVICQNPAEVPPTWRSLQH